MIPSFVSFINTQCAIHLQIPNPKPQTTNLTQVDSLSPLNDKEQASVISTSTIIYNILLLLTGSITGLGP